MVFFLSLVYLFSNHNVKAENWQSSNIRINHCVILSISLSELNSGHYLNQRIQIVNNKTSGHGSTCICNKAWSRALGHFTLATM